LKEAVLIELLREPWVHHQLAAGLIYSLSEVIDRFEVIFWVAFTLGAAVIRGRSVSFLLRDVCSV
jgi:hypothetical protein